MSEFTYDQIKIGQKAEFKITIGAQLIADFAKLSGDNNPLHIDPDYASQTEFGQPIAHGMIAGMLFSRLIGTFLPGKYSLYLSQSLTFHKPMFVDQEITITGEVLHKNDAFHTINLQTQAMNSSGEILVSGQALIKILK